MLEFSFSPTHPPVIQTTTKPRPRPTKPPTPKPIPLFPISTTNRPNYELVTAPDLFGNKGNETVETIDNNFIQDDDGKLFFISIYYIKKRNLKNSLKVLHFKKEKKI